MNYFSKNLNFFCWHRVTFWAFCVLTIALRPEKLEAEKLKSLNSMNQKRYQMKTLAENLSKLEVLNTIEMSKILGGTYNPTQTGVEDEDAWMDA